MTLDLVFMPPLYSTDVATPELLEYSNTALPFSYSDRLAAKILALVSEGKNLCSRFQDVRDVAPAGARFEYQEPALILSQRFETLIWESRSIAGIALAAVKDFNEVILDFLSEPDAAVQDRLKELANAYKLLKRKRDSAANHKSSFGVLIKELEDFHRMIHSELGALVPTRRRQCHSGGKGTRGTTQPSRTLTLPCVVPRSQPSDCLSTVAASLGTISRTCMDFALHFERIAENAVFPSCVSSAPEAQEASLTAPNPNSNPPERKRLRPPGPIEYAELVALPGLVATLVQDLRAFTSRADIFNTIFAELTREQDIFVVYLKDGQSVANQGYRSEINRLRRHLPCVCSALDAYSKARLS